MSRRASAKALSTQGLNVTIPYKKDACALADSASEDAQAIGAANTRGGPRRRGPCDRMRYARSLLGKALPGEHLVVLPRVSHASKAKRSGGAVATKSNFDQWLDFLFGQNR